jgi:lysophospholipase L1-like esterase
MRALIVGDSVSTPTDVEYQLHWVHRIRDRYPGIEFIDRTENGSTTGRLDSKLSLEWYDPDFVVTQLGIVDCSPRYLHHVEYEHLFAVVPHKVRSMYEKVARTVRRRSPSRTWVSQATFEENLSDYYDRAHELDVPVYSIAILPAYEYMLEKSPYIQSNIDSYNGIYQNMADTFENVKVIGPFNCEKFNKSHYSNGVHLNGKGHEILFQQITGEIPELSE